MQKATDLVCDAADSIHSVQLEDLVLKIYSFMCGNTSSWHSVNLAQGGAFANVSGCVSF